MFKTLTAYQLTLPTAVLLKRLPEALATKPFTRCLDTLPRSRGFVSPIEGGAELIYTANGGTLFCLRTDTKNVPASAVRERVEEARAAAFNAGEEFSPVDERVCREKITEGFLPGIPPSTRLTYAYIDAQLDMLLLGATGDNADEFVTMLGAALGGTAPLAFLSIADDPCIHYTSWAKDAAPLDGQFMLGTQWTLKHPGTDVGCGIINLKHEEVDSPEMLALIEGGREVCAITLDRQDIAFRLTSTLGLRNIVIKGEDDEVSTSMADQFARFVPDLRTALNDIGPILGGWTKQEVLDLKEE